ncbi:hypothetical protein [Rhizobium halophilum]|uniref:hypothetical protein n=1 Tax=Rhizobium halophilum TaxID=2846852 RepID=UPI001EFECD8F|nr:hypothetical protein [Rhizobium halophilum]MCF6371250.1 hypothetical protein [Rhizobium halophilum]
MKSPLAPFRPELLNTTKEAQDALARKLYAAVDVKAAMLSAAREGLSVVAISPAAPLDLRHTEAAQVLVQWLTQEGIECDWQERSIVSKSSALWAGIAYDLIISWGHSRVIPTG